MGITFWRRFFRELPFHALLLGLIMFGLYGAVLALAAIAYLLTSMDRAASAAVVFILVTFAWTAIDVGKEGKW